jgi:hypothetical protein
MTSQNFFRKNPRKKLERAREENRLAFLPCSVGEVIENKYSVKSLVQNRPPFHALFRPLYRPTLAFTLIYQLCSPSLLFLLLLSALFPGVRSFLAVGFPLAVLFTLRTLRRLVLATISSAARFRLRCSSV